MVFDTNKQKENAGLGMAIAYYSGNGYTVSIPLNDTQDYDIIVEKNNVFKTVQVKATGCKRKNGNYQVSLKSCGGTKGKTYKTVIETNVDIVFIITEDMCLYEIPKEVIYNKSSINICDKYYQYRVFL